MSDSFKGVQKSTLEEADRIYDADKFEETIKLLKEQNDWENNEQVLWRVARAEFQIAKQCETKDKARYTELVEIAYEHMKKSIALDDKDGLAHRWAAILLDAYAATKGMKERIEQVMNVRQHMERAIEYAPEDAMSHYLLGEWHFGCHSVSWWERKIANIAFGKIPDCDIEVALKMLERAEELKPGFYSKNKLALAKVLLELKRDKERAMDLLKDVATKYADSTRWDDMEAFEEANKLLKQHK